jgi:hypothetical protein
MKSSIKSLLPQNAKKYHEQVSVAVMLYISIPEMLGSNFRQDTGYLAGDILCFSSVP